MMAATLLRSAISAFLLLGLTTTTATSSLRSSTQQKQEQRQLNIFDNNPTCTVPTDIFFVSSFVRIKSLPLLFEDEDLLATSYQTAYNNLVQCPQTGAVKEISLAFLFDSSETIIGFANSTRRTENAKNKARNSTYILEAILECNACPANEDFTTFTERLFARPGNATTRQMLELDFDDLAASPPAGNENGPTKSSRSSRRRDTSGGDSPASEDDLGTDSLTRFNAYLDEDDIIQGRRVVKKDATQGGNNEKKAKKNNKAGTGGGDGGDGGDGGSGGDGDDGGSDALRCAQLCVNPTKAEFLAEYQRVFAEESARRRRLRAAERDADQGDTAAAAQTEYEEDNHQRRKLQDDVTEILGVVQVEERLDCNNTKDQFETFSTVLSVSIDTSQVNASDDDEFFDFTQDLIAAYNELNFYSEDTCDPFSRRFTKIERYAEGTVNRRRELSTSVILDPQDPFASASFDDAVVAPSYHQDSRSMQRVSIGVCSFVTNLIIAIGECRSCTNNYATNNDISRSSRQSRRMLNHNVDDRFVINWERDLQILPTASPASDLPDPGETVEGITEFCYCPIDSAVEERPPTTDEWESLLDEIDDLSEVDFEDCVTDVTDFPTSAITVEGFFNDFLLDVEANNSGVLSEFEEESFEFCLFFAYEIASLYVCDSNFISLDFGDFQSFSTNPAKINFNVDAQCRGCDVNSAVFFTEDVVRRQRNLLRSEDVNEDSASSRPRGRRLDDAAMEARKQRRERYRADRWAQKQQSDAFYAAMNHQRKMQDDGDGFFCFCDIGNEDDIPTRRSDFNFEFVDCVNFDLDLSEPLPPLSF
mmetsp:Transcript_11713/g.33762  ORF Transcript_11713/g.33762 Transcript_11713/m.33762 type:complete len:818 (+) Transcript_11713:266-2719(+)